MNVAERVNWHSAEKICMQRANWRFDFSAPWPPPPPLPNYHINKIAAG